MEREARSASVPLRRAIRNSVMPGLVLDEPGHDEFKIREGYLPAIRTPSRPANSWVNCQATRPDREPRVVDHSSASRSSSSSATLMPKCAQYPFTIARYSSWLQR